MLQCQWRERWRSKGLLIFYWTAAVRCSLGWWGTFVRWRDAIFLLRVSIQIFSFRNPRIQRAKTILTGSNCKGFQRTDTMRDATSSPRFFMDQRPKSHPSQATGHRSPWVCRSSSFPPSQITTTLTPNTLFQLHIPCILLVLPYFKPFTTLSGFLVAADRKMNDSSSSLPSVCS